jgi:hypothetical protein
MLSRHLLQEERRTIWTDMMLEGATSRSSIKEFFGNIAAAQCRESGRQNRWFVQNVCRAID